MISLKHSAIKLSVLLMCVFALSKTQAEDFTIAAASDLRYALDEIIAAFVDEYPAHKPTVIYGSSGQFHTQISNGAPYDLYFSADIVYPQMLHEAGLAVNEPEVYALGRIVLWSAVRDASALQLSDLASNNIRRIAIAQPDHAPYGQRAKEALQAAGVWETIQNKLVFGENIAHAAQMAESGAADIGIVALSLALFPGMATQGYHLIDADMHQPLTQAWVITHYGKDNPAAMEFANYMDDDRAHTIMQRYGFVMPE